VRLTNKFGILNDELDNDFTQSDDNVDNISTLCSDKQNVSDIDVINKKI